MAYLFIILGFLNGWGFFDSKKHLKYRVGLLFIMIAGFLAYYVYARTHYSHGLSPESYSVVMGMVYTTIAFYFGSFVISLCFDEILHRRFISEKYAYALFAPAFVAACLMVSINGSSMQNLGALQGSSNMFMKTTEQFTHIATQQKDWCKRSRTDRNKEIFGYISTNMKYALYGKTAKAQ